MRQLSHDVRIVYIDNAEESIQNCYNHQFKINNPNTYSSTSLNLVQTQTEDLNDINYLYISAINPIRLIFNGNNNIVCEHLSFINTETSFNVRIENNDLTLLENNIQVLYGRIDPQLTP